VKAVLRPAPDVPEWNFLYHAETRPRHFSMRSAHAFQFAMKN